MRVLSEVCRHERARGRFARYQDDNRRSQIELARVLREGIYPITHVGEPPVATFPDHIKSHLDNLGRVFVFEQKPK